MASSLVLTKDTLCRRLYEHFMSIPPASLEEIQHRIHAIRSIFVGSPGAGLSTGSLVDTFLVEYLSRVLHEFNVFHEGEADGKCRDIPFSLKTICGSTGSDLALSWSKNPGESTRETFTCPICILVLNTSNWWKKLPGYSECIHSGFYFVDPQWCKDNVTLSSNNKTNTLICKKDVYKMIQYAKASGTFIPFPNTPQTCKFDILSAFVPL